MMDPFKQHSNVTTAYIGSGKIKAVIPALLLRFSQTWELFLRFSQTCEF